MTTPNNEVFKTQKAFNRFIDSEKLAGFNADELEKFMQENDSRNPGKNPNNPWVKMENEQDSEI